MSEKETYNLDRLKTEQFGVFYGDHLYCSLPEKKIVIDGLGCAQEVIVFQGDAGEGKSTFSRQLMHDATEGRNFLDCLRINRPQRVLEIQAEGNRQEHNERMKTLSAHHTINISNYVHINVAGLSFNSEDDCKQLITMLEEPIRNGFISGYDIVVIDPLYQTIRGKANDSDVATEWTANFRKYMQGNRFLQEALFIIIAHPKKSSLDNSGKKHHADAGDIFGSNVWRNFFSGIWLFYKPKSNNKFGTKRKLISGKKRDADKMIDNIDLDFDEETSSYKILITGKSGEIFDYLNAVGGFVTKTKIVKYFRGEHNMPESTVKYHLNKLLNEKVVQSLKVNGKIGYKVTLLEKQEEEGVNG